MRLKEFSIVGYADKITVQPGHELSFMISTNHTVYEASVVRLLGGMPDPDVPFLPMETVPADCSGEYSGRYQETSAGSYAELPLPYNWLQDGEFAVQMWVFPTILTLEHDQTIWAAQSRNEESCIRLSLNKEGCLVFSLKDSKGKSVSVYTDTPLEAKSWYFICAHYSVQSASVNLSFSRHGGWAPLDTAQTSTLQAELDFSKTKIKRVLLAAEPSGHAASPSTHHHFNGKLENPRFYRGYLDIEQMQEPIAEYESIKTMLVADYDFGMEISTSRLVDRSGNDLHGTLRQGPTRAVTSHAWTGEQPDFRVAPEQYAAIHFHDDDIEDAGWEPDFTWKLPDSLTSGVYALRLVAGDADDYIPFFVRAAEGASTAPILFLAPTNTYLAYANEWLFKQAKHYIADLDLPKQDVYLEEHPELGKSIYDTHTDGSGVQYSSRLRPILNIRPDYKNWRAVRHFSADLYITGWLEKMGQDHDIATDEDLHQDGIELLKPYKVLITGSHPEYWTRPMLKALQQYLASGGRLMYLGGNGFYWVTSLAPDRPHLLEVRRGNAGTRSSDSPPGELHHSTTGEPGGLWRHYGFVPQQLVGIGFSALGGGMACGYQRLPDSFRPEVSFIFEGIEKDEVIGDFGLAMGGAAGDEVDRVDYELGTPRHALRLATSSGFSESYQLVHEELLFTSPGQGGNENPLVRSDITYFDIYGGGAVFAVGSINWAGSMACKEYENNVALISTNVLNHFLDKDK